MGLMAAEGLIREVRGGEEERCFLSMSCIPRPPAILGHFPIEAASCLFSLDFTCLEKGEGRPK